MTARIVFRTFVLALLLYSAVSTKCPAGGTSDKSILGWMLRGHVYDTLLVERPFTCVFQCREDNRCQSINWVISLLMCEFNNRTKEASPEDFIPNHDRSYYRRDLQRVPLGSIQELPAETCDEIKRSEGHAVSGKYWFSTIKSGTSVLANCNMETNDIDECGASTPVCDINANCSNTRGSYLCTCRAGYTGDGKTCQDIDECSASPPVCDVNANCSNTRGSYICTCKAGYNGDGKTCGVFPEGLTDSVIVGHNVHHLTNLSTWLKPVAQSESSKWKRCWRASVDGWNASTFHSGCDNKGPTVTIIRVGGKYIFGGYTNLSWGNSCQYRYDSQAFLFSLVNKPGWAPVKLPQTGQHSSDRSSVFDCSLYGPIFGGGNDIYMSASSHNSANLGYTYSPPSGYNYNEYFTKTFLAGTYHFTSDEVEIFYETT
ncbi:unnamed protein product [Porites lobata]|uniref:Uncharacterized protein n=1 Tax=Porites lobata TaxID=104759 RepID=A0ABN8QQV5_9CNID|nr:unnamed protein product [Porites lobata]